MTTYRNQPIWNPETGIVDLPGDAAALSASEIPGVQAVWAQQKRQLAGSDLLNEFTGRMTREWAIETGVIENLYEIERGVTQTLIERGFQAEFLTHGTTNKPREFVLNLLRDQQDALEGVFSFVTGQRELSVSYIKELHAALLRSQDTTEAVDELGRHIEIALVKGDWKSRPNSPVRDGIQFEYCPPEQVASEMDRLCEMHAKHREGGLPPDVQAAWLHHRFTQIHPFQDGNGRVARAIASLVLVKAGLFPLVVTRDDKGTYLDALEAADKGELAPLVSLISDLQIKQFRKFSRLSESILASDGVTAALGDFDQVAQNAARANLRIDYELANRLAADIETRLAELAPQLSSSLRRIDPNSRIQMVRSNANNDFWYKSQIVENAKQHLGYFANTSVFRAWVSLNVNWTKRARIVFAIHGFGKNMDDSMICAPFMLLGDAGEEGVIRDSLVPLCEEGFVFFLNEDPDRLIGRFHLWREEILTIAIKELGRSL